MLYVFFCFFLSSCWDCFFFHITKFISGF
jgi:hypothetical protein